MIRQILRLVLVMSISVTVLAQTKMFINKHNQTSDSLWLKDIKSITFRSYEPSMAGVIAYYPLNGDTKDYSGNGYDCVSSQVSPINDRFGRANSAMSFSATQSTCVSRFTTGFAATNVTISLWIKYAGGGNGNPRLFGVSGSETNAHAYSFIITHSFTPWNRLWFYCEPNSASLNTFSDSTVSNNSWKHVVVSYDGANVSFYINGVLDKTEAKTISIQAISSGVVTLGHSLSGTSPVDQYEGLLDDVRFYNRALSYQEIQNLYHEGGYTGQ